MWELFKHKFVKFGCFLSIALAAIAVTAGAKFILPRFGYNDNEANNTASLVGDYFMKGAVILVVLLGFVVLVFQVRRELRARSSTPKPPHLPSNQTPLPPNHPAPTSAGLMNPRQSPGTPPTVGRSRLFKGCMILVLMGAVLVVGGIGTIYYMAGQYEKLPKEPGQAACDEAENFVRSYKDREGSGNTPEAEKFAEDFARKLRTTRQFMFTEGRSGTLSLSEGYFLTYCYMSRDSVALIVHVPDLRNYTKDAQVTLSEYAWTLATIEARAKVPSATKLAVAIRGGLDYSAMMTGTISKDGEPLSNLQTRHPGQDTKPLWPYFVSSP
jgi:hypothetical protein